MNLGVGIHDFFTIFAQIAFLINLKGTLENNRWGYTEIWSIRVKKGFLRLKVCTLSVNIIGQKTDEISRSLIQYEI